MLAQQKLSCSSSMRLPSNSSVQQLACSQRAALQRPALRRMDQNRSRVSMHGPRCMHTRVHLYAAST